MTEQDEVLALVERVLGNTTDPSYSTSGTPLAKDAARLARVVEILYDECDCTCRRFSPPAECLHCRARAIATEAP